MALYLGIETSCDETSVAIVRNGKEILVNLIASQISIHAPFQGVVPELASRAHLTNIFPLLDQAMSQSGVSYSQLDGIGVTNQPGLLGALLVGVATAQSLAFALNLPLYGVHHIAGHIYAAHLEHQIEYPYLSLVVSGGHTSLYRVEGPTQIHLLGKTLDDAAGECFDKVAKLLELEYPGGPVIDKLARMGNPQAFSFPRSFQNSKDLQFSFSGLKTAVLYKLFGQDQKGTQKATQFPEHLSKPDLAASFQEAVVDILVQKSLQAMVQENLSRVTLVGGVACNSRLRQKLREALDKTGGTRYYPSPILCTDNAAMIAGLTAHLAQTLPKPTHYILPAIPN